MGSSFLLFEKYLYQTINPPPNYPTCSEEVRCNTNNSDRLDDFDDDDLPSLRNFIMYSVVITIISCFGIVGNIMSLTVLRRKELVGSVYTYLSVLAATDLALSIIFFLGGLARGAFYGTKLSTLDGLVGLPLAGAFNSMAVMATVGVTIDRCVYLWNPVHCTKPKFCNPKLARIFMSVSAVLSVILNVPYCFIFIINSDGTLSPSKFVRSSLYACYNWILLVIFTITPGTILIIGNSFLIRTLQKARRIKCNGRKRQDHRNLTITLIIIIVLFIIVEVPSNFISRTRAVTLIFFGANVGIDEVVIEIIREICTLLGTVNVTANFLLYYLLCPAFCRALKETFRVRTTEKVEKVQVNVIVLGENMKMSAVKSKFLEIAKNMPTMLKKQDANSDLQHSNTKPDESEYVEIINDYNDSTLSSRLSETETCRNQSLTPNVIN
ncbi:unnamed protein product [Diabrotica balteata]|uniref:G-protein coupled receptors family 1 profile domain-containing protein n=1 Tax=Diabrotica balteata TaxID=107213 RepID=A0A9N9SKN7_DIABA|nr:unnamed protein product [Diabrotica balteata]